MESVNAARISRLSDKEAYIIEREYDLAYLKFTVILVLLIIIIFYITCKFNMRQKDANKASSPVKVTQLGTRMENFTPNASILKNDIFRSDAAFDVASHY